MGAATDKSPKQITVYGRLSFPTLTAKEAYERSQKGSYPVADVASAKPDFQLLLDQAQHDKLVAHIETVFLPYCAQQAAAGEKKDALDAKEVKDLVKQVKSKDLEGVYNTPLKPVHEKSAELAPECVSTLKVIGSAGTDIDQRAIVRGEDELLPGSDVIQFPTVQPIGMTVHSLYPGCYVAVTLNLYAYHNGKLPGFSAGGNVAVFRANADRFGGGVTIDEDEMFLDD